MFVPLGRDRVLDCAAIDAAEQVAYLRDVKGIKFDLVDEKMCQRAQAALISLTLFERYAIARKGG